MTGRASLAAFDAFWAERRIRPLGADDRVALDELRRAAGALGYRRYATTLAVRHRYPA